jgi:hypothetical protein
MDRAAGKAVAPMALSACSVLVRRPWLVPTAVRVGLGLVPRRWWRRRPFLPLPDRNWLAFRQEVAYGDASAIPSGEDLADYLAWAREMHGLQGI